MISLGVRSGLRTSRPALTFRAYVPGIAAAAAAALAAQAAALLISLPPVFFALIAGICLGPILRQAMFEPGLTFSSKQLMRVGVALLGAQISAQQLAGLGVAPFLLAVGTLVACVGISLLIASRMRLSKAQSWLAAASVSICGASAALAVAAILPRSRTLQRDVAACIAAITIIGTAGMMLYPGIAELSGFDHRATGAFLGASLHEVVQAVGAGFGVSEEAGEVATTVKLVRVACLGPLIVLLAAILRRQGMESGETRPALLPMFVIAFALLCAASSLGLIPQPLLDWGAEASRLFLLMAIAAVGAQVSVGALRAIGPAFLGAIAIQSVVIALLAFTGVLAWQQGSGGEPALPNSSLRPPFPAPP